MVVRIRIHYLDGWWRWLWADHGTLFENSGAISYNVNNLRHRRYNFPIGISKVIGKQMMSLPEVDSY
jgi:hypothetical protein